MGLVFQERVGRRRMMLSMDPYTPGDPIGEADIGESQGVELCLGMGSGTNY